MLRIGGDRWVINGIYETIVIIIIFPLIVIMGAGENEKNEKIKKICKFLGEFSYPLYISHYPLMYCHISWYTKHTNDQFFNKLGVSVGAFFIIIFNTYALIKLYDEPVRKWLTEKYLIKSKNTDKKDNHIEHVEEKEEKNEKENNKILDENEIINEEEKKKNSLLKDYDNNS